MEKGKSSVSRGSLRRRRKQRNNLQLSSLNTDQAHLLLLRTLIKETSTTVKPNAMLDSGATGKGFIDESFAHSNKLH
jgi:hypothetical protein